MSRAGFLIPGVIDFICTCEVIWPMFINVSFKIYAYLEERVDSL